MNQVREQLAGVRLLLQQAQRLAEEEQRNAVFQVPHGQYTPLTHATSMRAGIRLMLVQLNHLLKEDT